jgi:hypothetical protein
MPHINHEDNHLIEFSTFLEEFLFRGNKHISKLVTYKEVELPEISVEGFLDHKIKNIGSIIKHQINEMEEQGWIWDDRNVYWRNPLKLRFVNKLRITDQLEAIRKILSE